MIRKISKLIKGYTDRKIEKEKNIEKQLLIKKVEGGTDLVIHKYGEALRKLGAYDKQ